jgi:hypothetical protein
MNQPAKKDNRMMAVGFALAAAACLIYASFTRQWLVNISQYEDRGVGLRSNYSCFDSETMNQRPSADSCRDEPNSELVDELRDESPTAAREVSAAFVPMGWATFVECLIGAFGLVAAAAIALAKKTPQLPMAPTTLGLLAIMATLGTGMVFIATKPGPPGYVGVGMSFWIFGIGAVLGIIGAQLLAKVNRPADPDLLADAMNPDQF